MAKKPNKKVYDKPYKQPRALVQHLKNKGLNFTTPENEAQAEDVLSKVNYYRFKSYLLPYLDLDSDRFKPGSEFAYGLALYDFDSELRTLCNKFLLKLEVKLRSQLDQMLTAHTKNPFWYLSNDYFSRSVDYVRSKIEKDMKRSHDEFAMHYRSKYRSNTSYYQDLPPFWIAAELTTFGMLTDLCMNLNKEKIGPQRDNPLDKLAVQFGATNWKELRSWLPLVKEIRNCCSHSSRTWNRNYRLPSGFVDHDNKVIPPRLTMPPTMKNKIYLGLLVIYLMTKHNLINGSCFKQDFQQLLIKFNHIPDLLHRMGIPSEWEQEPVWQ
ncbi:Abi family protein [Pseudoalteromonas sp. APC 3356]|jgi:abortive infection bacteriophage resistance protein|uniref:Abi family protein n=1 Tax=Pseudoalteromonas sp. APC 3356 TaxID=3035185 RepID=UPI0025B3E2A8|nr:Abi family protein [Pseudoalteromonas sp. APC 3356]MDN3436254.1 Abi family protein [Pseudoalteromonas sp. APC 3356]